MKKHSKVGNKPGHPAYRTPSTFIARSAIKRQRTGRPSDQSGKKPPVY